MLVVMGKRQVVAEQDHPHGGRAQQRQQPPDRRQILALNLDQLQVGRFGHAGRMHRLDER